MSTPLAFGIRRLRGLRSQDEFASDAEVSRITISSWETGRSVPRACHARRLVAMGLSEELFFPNDSPDAAGSAA